MTSDPAVKTSRPASGPGPEGAAVVLLSGGLDSTTMLAEVCAAASSVHALSFRYGQRHAHELDCARRQAERFGVSDHVVVDLAHLGELVAPASALVAASGIAVPTDGRHSDEGNTHTDIPVTYVPARNTLFLSYALAWAEVLGAQDIYIGVNAVDYSGYPDCRPAFIDAFERVANLATRVGVQQLESGAPEVAIRVRAPLLGLGKHEIIARGSALGVDYADTVSCYSPVHAGGVDSADTDAGVSANRSGTSAASTIQPGGPASESGLHHGNPSADPTHAARARPSSSEVLLACGRCDSCRLRLLGFTRAGLIDPARYVSSTASPVDELVRA